jgi:hypothetical protein
MKKSLCKPVFTIFFFFTVFGFALGQKVVKGLSLKAFNNTKQDGIVKVYMQTKATEGAEQTFVTQMAFTTSTATLDVPIPDIVKRGSYLCVYAELGKGGRSKSEYYQISKGTKNIQAPLDIPSGKAFGGTNFQDIKESMKYEPEKFVVKENYSTADLFNGLFGGLVVYGGTLKDTKIKQYITPVELGTRSETKFGQYSDKKTTIVARDQSATAKLSIPSIAGLSLDFSSADLFKLEINYKGAGPILWTPTPEMEDVATKFKKLSSSKLLLLGEMYDQDTSLKLAQIDNAYVYEAISFDLLKFNKLTSTTKVDGNVFFTATGNYSTNDEETQKQLFGSFMLGAWWTNDYTPLLKYAQKFYLDEKAKQIQEKQSIEDVKAIYNSLRISNTQLPEYTTKQKAIEDINKLNQTIKVNEEDIKKNPDVIVPIPENPNPDSKN